MLSINSDDMDSDSDYVLPGTPPDPNERISFLNISHKETISPPETIASTSNQPDVEASDDTESSKQFGRKRIRDESKWKRNVLKKKRASGIEHVSKSGKTVPARVTGKNCQCKFGCFDKVSQEVRDEIVANFNKLAEKNIQDMHLSGLISVSNVQRHRPKTGEGQNRAYSCHYKVRLGDFQTNVCKKAFCSFHGIGKSRVERIAKCLFEKNSFPEDNRGKHDNRPNKIPQCIIDTIDEHIQSFLSEKSHYSTGEDYNIHYLSPDLNVKKMHRLYLQKYEPEMYEQLEKGEKCHPTVSYDYYIRHFSTKYKLIFGTPRSNAWHQCDLLQNQLKTEKDPTLLIEIKNKKDVH